MNNIQISVSSPPPPPQNIIEKFEDVIKEPEPVLIKEITKSKYDMTSIKGFTEK